MKECHEFLIINVFILNALLNPCACGASVQCVSYLQRLILWWWSEHITYCRGEFLWDEWCNIRAPFPNIFPCSIMIVRCVYPDLRYKKKWVCLNIIYKICFGRDFTWQKIGDENLLNNLKHDTFRYLFRLLYFDAMKGRCTIDNSEGNSSNHLLCGRGSESQFSFRPFSKLLFHLQNQRSQ